MELPWTDPLPAAGDDAVAVVRELQAAGHRAYLVGGAVRDLILGRAPGDWDVATDARPDRLAALFPEARLVGASFGVVLVPREGRWVETATFRRDGVYRDGRRPDRVEYADDPLVDAARRDFTVNALYLDPVAGRLFDPVGGAADARSRVLRCVGRPEDRFGEDGLRLLRAARLAAELGFAVHPETRAGMAAAAANVDNVAPERVGDELLRLLRAPTPSLGLELLRETGVLGRVLPEVVALHGLAQSPDHHPEGCVWTHTLKLLDLAESPSPRLAWAALLHDAGKPLTVRREDGRIRFPGHAPAGRRLTGEILARLRRPSAEARDAAALVDQHMRFLDVRRMKPSTLKRFLAQPFSEDLLELHRLDRLAGSGDLDAWEFCRDALAALPPEELTPAPLLTGRDLIRLGYPRGPLLGLILEELETAQLEGEVRSRDAALDWLARRHPRARD